ncbi:glycoside hydrolase [Verrucomicrobia bacterium LW23]|nr:glycoside hydrolase [Verrucomicrobia bacterium LW23]
MIHPFGKTLAGPLKPFLLAAAFAHLNALALFAAPAAPEPTGLSEQGQFVLVAGAPVGEGFSYTKLQHGVQIRLNGITRNVIFYGPSTVRVNTNLGEAFTEQPSLVVVKKPAAVPFRLDDQPDQLSIVSDQVRLIVDKKSGALTFLDSAGKELTRERPLAPADIRKVTISDAPTYEIRQGFVMSPDESLYGLGQCANFMDYRGREVLLVQTNIGIIIPFMVSTRRYGIMWDVYSKMTFKDDSSGAVFSAESAPAGVDYYFMAGGGKMDGVISAYRQLTGEAPMFPKAAFGLFMSKERYKTQERLLEVVRAFRRDGFPLDYIVQDWQYWGGTDGTWSGMTWDKQRFPDPAGMARTLHDELHVKLMVSIWPSVGNDTELARELDAKGLRFEPLHWISKKARIYDAFSAEGREIYFKHIKKGLFDVGVDALWMDGTEVEVGGACHNPAHVEADIKKLGKNAMGDFTRYLNPYSLVTTQGTYEGQRATSNKRVFTLTRSAFTGQQRYGAVSWSGDTTAGWDTLRAQIVGGINVAMAGQPYWTQDTGGFFVRYPGGEKNPEYRELLARWNQFAIFNPIYRIHGTSVEREPYIFREMAPDIYKSLLDAAKLRYRLLPYIYSLAWQSTSNGYTMMRGLPMDFPDDMKSRKLTDEFMFGPAFLVQTITRPMYYGKGPAMPLIPPTALLTPDGKPGLAGQYFEGTNLEKPLGAVVDGKIEHTWPGPPLAEFPGGLKGPNHFSARWEGSIVAEEDGEHEIGIEADDGYRLWLDGKLVAEDWKVAGARYAGTRVTLAKGQKLPVKIEYFQGTGNRLLRLSWRTPSAFREIANTRTNNSIETWLPPGADWYNFWTNERVTGGATQSMDCPLDRFPLYVRAGSIVPMGPDIQYATEKADAPWQIRIYPGANASFTIYEDDNETYDYEKGQYATYTLAWDDAAKTLTLSPRKGAFPGMIPERELNIVLIKPGVKEPAPATTIRYSGQRVVVKL